MDDQIDPVDEAEEAPRSEEVEAARRDLPSQDAEYDEPAGAAGDGSQSHDASINGGPPDIRELSRGIPPSSGARRPTRARRSSSGQVAALHAFFPELSSGGRGICTSVFLPSAGIARPS